jgi:lactate 2-monooxygenase
VRLNRCVANYGDWQFGIYLDGLSGKRPALPMSYAELERQAEECMSPEMWSYVAGGAGNERTQRANVRAFDGWGLMPRMLAAAAERDLSVDLASARAAAAMGVPMVASTLSQDPMEAVTAEFGDTPGWFQLYPPADREVCESLVRRAEAAGFSAIVITLDTLTLGWRPRDLALASFPQLKGLCLANYTSDPVFRSRLAVPPEEDLQAATGQWALLFGNQRLSWDDLPWLRSLTSLPLLLKGVCAPQDARRAVDAGIDGLWCSNHGGRQANGGLPALDCLPGVVDAAGAVPVIFDSGVRSGADVAIALALGARAVAIGRPYAYGLAVGGQAGIEHVLRCMLAELDLLMAVDGYPSVTAFDRDAVHRVR